MKAVNKLCDLIGIKTPFKNAETRNTRARQSTPTVRAVEQIQAQAPRPLALAQLPPPVEVAPKYSPSNTYRFADLLLFAASKNLSRDDAVNLSQDLLIHLYNQNISPVDRFKACSALSIVLPADATLEFAGARRGGGFFASMAVDVFLANKFLESHRSRLPIFIDVLSNWLDNIAPDRQDFPIQGVVIERDAIVQWLCDLTVPNRTPSTSTQQTDLTRSLERIMYGATDSRRQNVHDANVIRAGDLTFKKMNGILAGAALQPFNEVEKSIATLALPRTDAKWVTRGVQHVKGHRLTVAPGEETPRCPVDALRTLWTYIARLDDRPVAANLQDALLLRLSEIGQELPCFTGCLERILDVPTGIDPALNIHLPYQHIKQDVVKIAGRVQNKMDDLFDGTELANLEGMEGVDPEVLNEIRVSIFKETASQELGRLRGIPENVYEREVNKMSPGFIN